MDRPAGQIQVTAKLKKAVVEADKEGDLIVKCSWEMDLGDEALRLIPRVGREFKVLIVDAQRSFEDLYNTHA